MPLIAWCFEKVKIGDTIGEISDIDGELHHQPVKILAHSNFNDFKKQFEEMTGKEFIDGDVKDAFFYIVSVD